MTLQTKYSSHRLLGEDRENLKLEESGSPSSSAPQYAGAQPPLVSFVVVNHNYGRYLRQCVESIFAQTYPFVECIVVDNKSTDNSAEIIAALLSSYPQLGVVYEPANLGQSAACVDGYRKSSGQFVVFVDADDYYFETFVETHLLVHLSSAQLAGFSSSDMVQVVDGTVVGTCIDISAKDAKRSPRVILGPPPSLAALCTSTASERVEIERLSVRSIHPKTLAWVWAPTSGTMYRRDAIDLFADCPDLRLLRCSTDAFFNYGVNALTGSLLIEKTLGAYRIHGRNQFTQVASLRNLRNTYEVTDESPQAAKFVLRHVVANFDRFAERLSGPGTLDRALGVYARKAAEIRFRRPFHRALRAFATGISRFFWRLRTGI